MNRERIEEILAKIEDDKIGEIEPNDLHELCTLATLALRGLPPKVEWREIIPNKEFQFLWGEWVLRVFNENGWWLWQIECKDRTIDWNDKSVRDPKAAQKAAEDALAKLVGGEG